MGQFDGDHGITVGSLESNISSGIDYLDDITAVCSDGIDSLIEID